MVSLTTSRQALVVHQPERPRAPAGLSLNSLRSGTVIGLPETEDTCLNKRSQCYHGDVFFPFSLLVLNCLIDMKFGPIIFAVAILFSFAAISVQAQQQSSDWSRWRGPQGNGVADGQKPVTKWDESTNVIWKTKVPGKGHSSPLVTPDKIFLTTADKEKLTQSVLCYDRNSGELLWEKVAVTGSLPAKIHKKNTHASSTVAIYKDLVFSLFYHGDSQTLTAFKFDGEMAWEKKLDNYNAGYPFGSGASPIIYGDLLIIPHESKTGELIALDAATGEERWTAPRTHTSYSTPVVANVGGKFQLLLSGYRGLTSYNPDTGEKNWSTATKWSVTCATAVWDKDRVYASGGYPVQETIAVTSDGSKKLWDLPLKSYEQSMIVVDGHLYLVTDRGVLYCIDGETGEIAWKTRFKAPISASPVLAGGNIYFTAENGQTLIFKPNPEKFEKVATNQLGNSAFASFALVDNHIITRVGERKDGGYQEWLYCIGEK